MEAGVLDSGLIGGRKILVTYFPHSGNTRDVAEEIHGNVGGSMFQIEAAAPYPGDYNGVVKQAKEELDSGCKPSLKTKIGDLETYDLVFLGYPNWWGAIPGPVRTLLWEEDFSGRSGGHRDSRERFKNLTKRGIRVAAKNHNCE